MDQAKELSPGQHLLLKEARARRAKALKLHMAGKSKKEIGAAMGGISRQRVEKMLALAIRDQQPG